MVWCLSTSKDGLKELLLYIARCQLQPIEYQSFFFDDFSLWSFSLTGSVRHTSIIMSMAPSTVFPAGFCQLDLASLGWTGSCQLTLPRIGASYELPKLSGMCLGAERSC